jgi:hypothetical protein
MVQQLILTALKLSLGAIRAACFQLATSEMVAVTAAFLDHELTDCESVKKVLLGL